MQLDRVAPVRTRRRRPQKPIPRRLSAEAADAKRERRSLERRWQATRAETDQLNYRRACRKANQRIEVRPLQPAQAGSDARQLWKIVSELLHSKDTDKTRTDDEN